ncbi:MAG: hypothetical protein IT208_06765 [Chthonomonadales bacterium]|nr:hypothetical protein [Chthonomonadales bacterium]
MADGMAQVFPRGLMDGHPKYVQGGHLRQARVIGPSNNAPYGSPPGVLDLNWLVRDDGNRAWDPSDENARDTNWPPRDGQDLDGRQG